MHFIVIIMLPFSVVNKDCQNVLSDFHIFVLLSGLHIIARLSKFVKHADAIAEAGRIRHLRITQSETCAEVD